jgi:hypothetical protein
MRARFRFDPINVFGPLEILAIFSLIYCPAPWLSSGGYPAHAVIWSIGLGIVLAAIAYAHAVMGSITFGTHLAGVGAVGLTCIALSLISVPRASAAFIAFLATGIVLLIDSVVMGIWLERTRKSRHHEEEPEMPIIEKRAA